MTVLWLLHLLHLIGFALLVTSTAAGWILFRKYEKLDDYRSQAVLLGASRTIGLFSPLGIVIMLVSGIGQMHLYGLGVFTAAWLTLKLFFFLIAAVAGTIFGIRGAARGTLVAALARGDAEPDAVHRVKRLDSQLRVFYLLQSTLLLLILLLAVIKPGPQP